MKPVYTTLFILFIAIHSYAQDNAIAITTGTRTAPQHIDDETAPFVNGFAKTFLNNKWNLIDQQGKTVSTTGFDGVRNFVNHLAAFQQQSKWGFINEKGAIVIAAEYDIIYDFTENVTAGYKGGKWFLVNKQGAIIKPLSVDVFNGFKNGIAKISRDGRNGTLNIQGNIIALENAKTTAVVTAPQTSARTEAVNAGSCPVNIGFELGSFANWSAFTGSVEANGTSNRITVTPSVITPNRHTLISRASNPGLDPYGLFPITPPDGSGYAVRLGNNINGAEAERITYQVTVPADASEASITYRYAVVFEDPGHEPYEQPRFIARVRDIATGEYLPCASYQYISTAEIPGFNSSTVDPSVKFKTWTPVFINLSKYAGKDLILEFTTADCTKGKHWGYAYVDVGDCDIAASATYTCNPDIATFTAPAGFKTYNWFDDSRNKFLGTGEHLVLNPAPKINSVSVHIIPYNGYGCSDTLHVKITPEFPIADAGPDKDICIGGSASIGTPPPFSLRYSWSPGDFLNNAATAVVRSKPDTTTTYVVTATHPISGCTAKDTVTVRVYSKPVPEFSTDSVQCFVGNKFFFHNTSTNESGGSTYSWQFTNSDSSKETHPTFTFDRPGIFNVKLTANGAGNCPATITHPVIVKANPVIKTTDNMAICKGETAQLRATGGSTYAWSPAVALSCSDCPAPKANPGNSVVYTVTGFNSAGCKATDTIAITVHQPININVSPNRVMCEGETIDLLANGTATHYRWSPTTGLSSFDIPNPVSKPKASTLYRVVGYDDHQCFTDTGYIQVTVNPKPTVNLGPDLTLSTGTIHAFNPSTKNGPIVKWQWTPSENLSCSNCSNPTTEVKRDFTYIASVENTYGCTDIDTINIRTFCKGSQVYIPNGFTPDGDGLNDILIVRGKGIAQVRSFRIYSRWGELVFERNNFAPNDPRFGWDGKIKGKTGAAEVYVFTCEVICENDVIYTYKGNTTLLK